MTIWTAVGSSATKARVLVTWRVINFLMTEHRISQPETSLALFTDSHYHSILKIR